MSDAASQAFHANVKAEGRRNALGKFLDSFYLAPNRGTVPVPDYLVPNNTRELDFRKLLLNGNRVAWARFLLGVRFQEYNWAQFWEKCINWSPFKQGNKYVGIAEKNAFGVMTVDLVGKNLPELKGATLVFIEEVQTI